MLAGYLAATLALALLTLLPGPDLVVVTRFALADGRAAATRAALGIITGLAIWGALGVLGLAAVLSTSATAYTAVKVAGALVLVAMGVHALWRSRSGPATPGHPAGATTPAPHAGLLASPLRSGLLTNLLNPKIGVFYTSLLPTLVPVGGSPRLWLPLLVATHAVLSLAWLTGYAAVLARTRSVVGRPRVRTALERLTGAVLIGLGLRVAADVH